jgi:hypothetical protein
MTEQNHETFSEDIGLLAQVSDRDLMCAKQER